MMQLTLMSAETQIEGQRKITGVTLVVSESSLRNFQRLVERATNTWDDAPVEIKELADMMHAGCVLQKHPTGPHLKSSALK
jgi:hypothetical protein